MFYVSKNIGIYGGAKTYSRLQESMVSPSSGMVCVVCVPCFVLKMLMRASVTLKLATIKDYYVKGIHILACCNNVIW